MQGFNMGRYVPPDLEGTTSANKLHSKLPPGRSASKPGVQTVRFEMPYAIWCSSCPKPTIIGQGVRFNAEKSRAGSYYSTPIWSFRMRHADCGGAIEIRTDPQNTAYVVVSGAKKRDTGPEDTRDGREVREGEYTIVTDKEREALRKSAFASLEKTIEDREALRASTARIDELEDVSKRQWEDPGERNRALRKTFRVGRKEREKQALTDEGLKESMGLGIDLLPAREEDARRAALVDFAPDENGGRGDGTKALVEPLFRRDAKDSRSPAPTRSELPKGTPKKEIMAAKHRKGLQAELVSNTRLTQDPFLVEPKISNDTRSRTTARIPGVKRKRDTETSDNTLDDRQAKSAATPAQPESVPKRPHASLVAYASDSDD